MELSNQFKDNTNAKPQEAPVMPNIVQSSAGSSKNNMMWIIVAAVIVILVIIGVYFYISSQNNATPSSQSSNQTSTQDTTAQGNLDSDLNAINVGSGEEDFSSVDADLKSL